MCSSPAPFLLCVIAALLQQARCDLGAALRRAGNPLDRVAPVEPLAAPLALQLERVPARGGANGSFYVGRVSVGQPPKELRVLFDTSSGNVLIPHRACRSHACLEHQRYSPWESITAQDVDSEGRQAQNGSRLVTGAASRDSVVLAFTQADLGTGDAKAVLVRDTLCLRGSESQACTKIDMSAAFHMDDVPFRAMPSDGIVGLGLVGLSASPLSNFLARLLGTSTGVLPELGISLGSESGEIFFGGHDKARLAAEIRWFPVDHPEEGFWQVAIQAVRVGGVVVDACEGGCHGIVDTSASRLGVQYSRLPKVRAALASAPTPGGKCQGPELEFDLGGMVLTLQSEDYADEACAPQLGPLDVEEPKFLGVYAFGETVLRRYYAAFDWATLRIGFAPAAKRAREPSAPRAHALGGVTVV